MAVTIQFKKGLDANLPASAAAGEPLFTTDSHRLFVGTGSGLAEFAAAPAGPLALADGGTGASLSDPGADRLVFWDDSAGSVAFLDVGSGLSISGTTLAATGSGGTVTSVGLALPAHLLTVTASPVTGSGTLTATLTAHPANLVFAGPATGADAVPSFRSLVAADLPAHTHTAADVTDATAVGLAVLTAADAAAARSAIGAGTGAGTVTSVDASGGTTGLTFTGGPVTSSGTLTLGGTLAVASGGTGSTTASAARTALGLAVGSNVQAWSANLDALAAFSGPSIPYRSSSGWTGLTVSTGLNLTTAGVLTVAGSITGVALTMNTARLLGRTTAGGGAIEEITVGSGLTFSGGTLSNANTGTVTSVDASGGTTGLTLTGGPVTSSGTLTLGGTLAVANGGTGSTTAAAARTALGVPAGSGTSTGTNTGDQTITLTGNVTGSGTGSFATTIAAGAVTLARMADVATGTVFYRKTAGTGAPEVQTLATLKTDLGLTGTNSGDQTITLTGDVTGSGTGSFATAIGAGKVTNAMLAGSIDLATKVTGTLPAANLPTATQADQETGTSTTKLLTPGVQQFHPSAAKAWVTFTVSGGVVTVRASYNVSSVTRNAAGDFTVNFTTAFSGANAYAMVGAASVNVGVTSSLGVMYSSATAPAAGSCRMVTGNFSTGTTDDPQRCSVAFFGDQ